jgi:hypothetical protein
MLRSITFHHISMAVGSGWVLSRVGRYTDMWGPLKSKLNLHRQTALPLQGQHFGRPDLGVLSWGGFVGGTGSVGATMAQAVLGRGRYDTEWKGSDDRENKRRD